MAILVLHFVDSEQCGCSAILSVNGSRSTCCLVLVHIACQNTNVFTGYLPTAREGFSEVCHSVHRGSLLPGLRVLGSREVPPVLTSSTGHCSGRYASYWNAFLLHFYGEKFQYLTRSVCIEYITDRWAYYEMRDKDRQSVPIHTTSLKLVMCATKRMKTCLHLYFMMKLRSKYLFTGIPLSI